MPTALGQLFRDLPSIAAASVGSSDAANAELRGTTQIGKMKLSNTELAESYSFERIILESRNREISAALNRWSQSEMKLSINGGFASVWPKLNSRFAMVALLLG